MRWFHKKCRQQSFKHKAKEIQQFTESCFDCANFVVSLQTFLYKIIFRLFFKHQNSVDTDEEESSKNNKTDSRMEIEETQESSTKHPNKRKKTKKNKQKNVCTEYLVENIRIVFV